MASERIKRRIERLLDQIEQEADQRNWQLVLELAREVLGFAPDDTDAQAFLAVAEDRLAFTSGAEFPALHRSSGLMPAEAPTAGHPTSFANGRYQVKQFLGEGGKKRVYLAHDGILASRIAGQAQGGEILVSSLLNELTDGAGDIRFGRVKEVELEGLTRLNRVYSVEWK